MAGAVVPVVRREPETAAPPALVAAVVLLAVLATGAGGFRPHLEGDTVTLIESAAHLRACVREGAARCPAVSTSSLQQLSLVVLAQAAGLDTVTIGRRLALVSGAAIAGLVALAAMWLPASARVMGVALIATSPLVYYARSTFGEALAALSLVALVLHWRRGDAAPWTLAALAAWASLAKDTMPPFVIGLGVLAAWIDRTEGRDGAGRRLGAAAAGALCGWATFAALHLYRVGAPYNTEYLGHPEFFLSRPFDVGSAFLGHWFSPTVGLVWCWPLAAVLLWRAGRVGAGAAMLLVAQAAGLSTWWSPFGWVAWGDRLMYPLTAAATLLCLSVTRPRAPAWRVPLAVWGVAVVAVVATCAMLVDNTALGLFFAPDVQFPGPPTIQADVELYRRFLRHLTWQRWYDVERLVAPLRTASGVAVLALKAVVAACLWRAHTTTVERY